MGRAPALVHPIVTGRSHRDPDGSWPRRVSVRYIPGQGTGAPADLPQTAPKCLWVDVAKLLRDAGFTDPTNPTRAGSGMLEGSAYVPTRGENPALLAVLNDNDFGLVLPIPEQLDVVAAPPVCATG